MMRRVLSLDGRAYRVEARPEPGGLHLRLLVEGVEDGASAFPVPGGFCVRRGRRTVEAGVILDGSGEVVVEIEGETFRLDFARSGSLRRGAPRIGPRGAPAGPREVRTPMPGKVVRILRRDGDPVEAGERVLVFEAMKMQNEIRAPESGVIANMRAVAGAPLSGGEFLFAVEPAPSP